MVNKLFFDDKTIANFVSTLRRELDSLPPKIREQHIDEIKSELYEKSIEKNQEGFDERDVPTEVVKDFSPPKEIAINILSDYGIKSEPKGYKFITYYPSLSLGPIAACSIPILLGFVNFSALLPFILSFIFSNLYLVIGRINWTEVNIELFAKITKATSWTIAIPFTFFSIRLMLTKEFEPFIIKYLVGYTLIWLGYYLFINYFTRHKKTVIY